MNDVRVGSVLRILEMNREKIKIRRNDLVKIRKVTKTNFFTARVEEINEEKNNCKLEIGDYSGGEFKPYKGKEQFCALDYLKNSPLVKVIYEPLQVVK